MEITTSFCNRSLNISEQSAVKASLTEVRLNENFKSTRFWGKIFGVHNDYLIIEATSITHQIQHKYFFSVDGGLRFAQLPIVEPWMQPKCMKIASLFTGITSFVYADKKKKSENETDEEDEDKKANQAEEEEEEVEEDANGENKDDPDAADEPPEIEQKLTELDRVAWTISKINQECYIVPKNSILLTSSKLMQRNVNFSGLSRNDANKLESYLHFRTPQSAYSVSKYRKATAMNDTDFLDAITEDVPNGCWKLKAKKSGLEISIKNLLWNGFEFKYSAGETQYIQSYFGYGIRQNDLVFMI
mmetsp:Transcript_45956/g.73618  ORF Transcript_45956/g.73618 Transcript_45956/m.73618 type:complete len:302 (+) Transcript_45956:98-1003(+)